MKGRIAMGGLTADAFASDSRVAQAKRLLLEALADHQKRIAGIRPPLPDLQTKYSELLRHFGELRGGSLFFPYLGSGFGKGPLVELADGSVKYDFITGIGVHYWGHNHPLLLEASLEAALGDTIMQGNLQQNVESESLVRTLLDAANRKGAFLKHCFLTTSGAMANENALKLIFQKKSPASRILAFEGCFAGRTLALSQITDKPAYRVGLPATLQVDYVPFYDPAHPRESSEKAVAILRRHLARYPGQHAAMVFELVLGEGGFYPGEHQFFVALMDVLKEHDVAILIDEIQTFGRTKELFAFQHFGLDEYVDVVTIGKLSQVCATIFREDFKPQPGSVSQTFTASTSGIYASKAIIRELLDDGYFGSEGKIARLHSHFENRLGAIEKRHPEWFRGPFGIGAMIAFTVFAGDLEKTKTFLRALFEAGVIGFYAGSTPVRVRFLIPAGAISFEDIDVASEIIEKTLVQVAASM